MVGIDDLVLETDNPGMREIYRRRQTRHGLHLVLTILTCGGWLLVWPFVWAWNAFGPRERTVIVDVPHYMCGWSDDPYCRHTDPPRLKGSRAGVG